MESTLEVLEAKARRDYEAVKARKRLRYRFARNLGFNSAQAKLLSGRSERYIAELTKLKASQ